MALTFSGGMNFSGGVNFVAPRRNLLNNPTQFDTASWIKTSLNTTGTPPWVNVAVAPDSTTTAYKLIENTAPNAYHSAAQQVSTSVNIPVTVSVYAKSAGRSRIVLSNQDLAVLSTAGAYAVFNLDTGIIDVAVATYGSGFSATSAQIESAGNGWYRCIIAATFTGGTRAISINLDKGTSGGIDQQYTGDGISGVFVWGAQVENGSSATPFQNI